jgi:hypothetical protein
MILLIVSTMEEEYPIRDEDEQKIINRFEKIDFYCIRCGARNLNKKNIRPYCDGIDFKSAGRVIESVETFFVEGNLFCNQCKHNFHVKILDQKK